ncbi:MAG: D-cysteine desulfhydrase family protein [Woeseiaceae bacterium]
MTERKMPIRKRPSSTQTFPAELGALGNIRRTILFDGVTPLEFMPNLSEHCGGARLFVKRDDCTGLTFGGNKVRQIEFYLGEAVAQRADTILITGAVQSNFVRTAAAAARQLGMECHIQQEERVANTDQQYRESGNVLIVKLLGATLSSYPSGEDEAGADRQVGLIADELRAQGRNPYIIPLGPGHAPLGALGYVVAAQELLHQVNESGLEVENVFVGSGSGATHGGLLFGLKTLGSKIGVIGVCVRREAELQRERIANTCAQIATLLGTENPVADADIKLDDGFLAPGYGVPGQSVLDAIMLAARTEGLILDPVYTGKVMAGTIHHAKLASPESSNIFLHTGGTPAIFAYQDTLAAAAVSHST